MLTLTDNDYTSPTCSRCRSGERHEVSMPPELAAFAIRLYESLFYIAHKYFSLSEAEIERASRAGVVGNSVTDDNSDAAGFEFAELDTAVDWFEACARAWRMAFAYYREHHLQGVSLLDLGKDAIADLGLDKPAPMFDTAEEALAAHPLRAGDAVAEGPVGSAVDEQALDDVWSAIQDIQVKVASVMQTMAAIQVGDLPGRRGPSPPRIGTPTDPASKPLGLLGSATPSPVSPPICTPRALERRRTRPGTLRRSMTSIIFRPRPPCSRRTTRMTRLSPAARRSRGAVWSALSPAMSLRSNRIKACWSPAAVQYH